VTTDYDFADRLAIPTGAFPNYLALLAEKMAYRSHPVYYRTHVMPIMTAPGATCPAATVLALGVPSFWSQSGAGVNWWAMPVNLGQHYTVNISFSVMGSIMAAGQINEGICSAFAILDSFTAPVPVVFSFTATGNDFLLIELNAGGGLGVVSYTIRVTSP
jgi:hypothetical protein